MPVLNGIEATKLHRFAALGLARTFQTPRVFADMPVLTNIEFGLKFAGRRPRKYWLWGDEQGVPWALRDAANLTGTKQGCGGTGNCGACTVMVDGNAALSCTLPIGTLEGADVTDVYNLVLSEVEAPLLETVMNYVKGNQTKASELLGLNRGTLRKKLKQYDLL